MRDAFITALTALARRDRRIVAVTADLGVRMFEPLASDCPGRFLNVGIAEQTLVGVAAGLAYAGKIPFAYSQAPFITSRAHDQVRIDVAFARADVKLVAVGGGLGYGYLGATHHGIEDIALMRALPDMTVLTPGDPVEAAQAIELAAATPGPVYVRLGKNGEPVLLQHAPGRLELGRARRLRPGRDVTLISCGTMLGETLAAADALQAGGVGAGVLHMGCLKPFDDQAVRDTLREAPLVATVEEHTIIGGLGSAVAEAMAESGLPGRLVRIGIPDSFAHEVGTREHLLDRFGASSRGICERVTAALAEGGRRAA